MSELINYREEKRDLFSVDNSYYFVQCVSADFKLGAGIAIEFNKRFDIKNKLINKYGTWVNRWANFQDERGTCILEGRVYNLITKCHYWHKPTLDTMKQALEAMKVMIQHNPNCKKIAMPKIGCGLDRLNWKDVSELIKQIFMDTDIEILVCYQ